MKKHETSMISGSRLVCQLVLLSTNGIRGYGVGHG